MLVKMDLRRYYGCVLHGGKARALQTFQQQRQVSACGSLTGLTGVTEVAAPWRGIKAQLGIDELVGKRSFWGDARAPCCQALAP